MRVVTKEIFYRNLWLVSGAFIGLALPKQWKKIMDGILSSTPLLGANVENIIASNEGVAILVLQLTIAVLFSLFKCNIHVPIQASQHTCRK